MALDTELYRPAIYTSLERHAQNFAASVSSISTPSEQPVP